ncbi:MAG: hypothetical protein AAF518_06845 [Spirochaetota bacterium]
MKHSTENTQPKPAILRLTTMKLVYLMILSIFLSYCASSTPKNPKVARALDRTLETTPAGDEMVQGLKRQSKRVVSCSNSDLEKDIAGCDQGVVPQLQNACRSNDLDNFQYINLLQNYKQMHCQ